MDSCHFYVFHVKKALEVATCMHDPEAYFEPEIWAILPENYINKEEES